MGARCVTGDNTFAFGCFFTPSVCVVLLLSFYFYYFYLSFFFFCAFPPNVIFFFLVCAADEALFSWEDRLFKAGK